MTAQTGSAIMAPASPVKDWYTFDGWYIKDTDTAFEFSVMPACDVLLYAKWKIAEGYASVVVENGTGTGIYQVGSVVVIGGAVEPDGMRFVKWVINGEDYTYYYNFYYTVNADIHAVPVFESADIRVAAGENCALVDFEIGDYPVEDSRIAKGYSRLYIRTDGGAALAEYPDGSFVFEEFSGNYLSFVWGEIINGDYVVYGKADVGYGHIYLYDEVSPNAFYHNFGTYSFRSENLIIDLADCIYINADFFEDEVPPQGREVFSGVNTIFCETGKNVSYVEGIIAEFVYVLSHSVDPEAYDSAEVWNGLTVNVYIHGFTPEDGIEGFDSSYPHEGTIGFRSYEVQIIYLAPGDLPIMYSELVWARESALKFDVGEAFSGEKLRNANIYFYHVFTNFSIRMEAITEDMVTGFATSAPGKYEMTITFGHFSATCFYYVIAEDTPADEIIAITEGTLYIYSDGTMEGSISLMLANGWGEISSANSGYAYSVDLAEAIANNDLILPDRIYGYCDAPVTYKGKTGIISIYCIDKENPQIFALCSGDLSAEDDKIYVSTEGQVSAADALITGFFLDDWTVCDVPPLRFLYGIDLTATGRQKVKIYSFNGVVYDLYIVVYEA